MRFLPALCMGIALLLASAMSFAQPAPGSASTPDKKSEAQAHFEKGLALVDKKAWEAALAEFSRSMQLYSSRPAVQDAARCLRKLNRNGEALDLYYGLLHDSRELPPDMKVDVQAAVVELRKITGTIEVDAGEPGAAVSLDGRRRGEHPLPAPLHVDPGRHVVLVYREGFVPFETSVDVAAGQSAGVTARMVRLIQSGRLRVAEKGGKALDVVVDGIIVGTTPWEGPIAVGEHTVMLRGEERFGTPPVPVRIKNGERTELAYAAEELDAVMRVAPIPADASVAIDGTFVGRGTWEGHVRPGTHKVELVADGYFKVQKNVKIERGGRESVSATMERDPSSPRWRKPGRFMLEVGGAVALWPSFGGDLQQTCTGTCKQGLALGGEGVFDGGYELGSGFGFGLEAGYLYMEQAMSGRTASVQAVGIETANEGTVDETLKLRGVLAGAFAGFSFGEQWRLRLRLGAGALIGSTSVSRTGKLTTSKGTPYDVGPLVQTPGTAWFYLDPNVRLGVRLGDYIEVSAGVGLRILISPSPPTWDATQPVNAAGDGYGNFAAEVLTSSVLLALSPGVGARYTF